MTRAVETTTTTIMLQPKKEGSSLRRLPRRSEKEIMWHFVAEPERNRHFQGSQCAGRQRVKEGLSDMSHRSTCLL